MSVFTLSHLPEAGGRSVVDGILFGVIIRLLYNMIPTNEMDGTFFLHWMRRKHYMFVHLVLLGKKKMTIYCFISNFFRDSMKKNAYLYRRVNNQHKNWSRVTCTVVYIGLGVQAKKKQALTTQSWNKIIMVKHFQENN
jgi:hypothetical protein